MHANCNANSAKKGSNSKFGDYIHLLLEFSQVVSRGKIVFQGVQNVEILNDPSRQSQFFNVYFGNLSFPFRCQRCVSVAATEGNISFTLRMSPEFSPELRIVAYVILPSEHMIAHKADLAVTKCFLNKVGWCASQTCVCLCQKQFAQL